MEEINNFLTPAECEVLIQMIDSNHSRSSVVATEKERASITDHRTSSTCNLDMRHPLIKDIHERISLVLNLEIERGESLQGQVYKPGEYFKPHNDFFTGAAYDMHCKASGNRTHTLMVYLNEGMKGGGTNLTNLNKLIKPETGKALWWYNMKDGQLQSQYLHEGVAVEEGKKYVVTSWWREKKWDGAGDERMYREFQENPSNKTVGKIEESSIVDGMQNKSYIVKASQASQIKTPVEKKEF